MRVSKEFEYLLGAIIEELLLAEPSKTERIRSVLEREIEIESERQAHMRQFLVGRVIQGDAVKRAIKNQERH